MNIVIPPTFTQTRAFLALCAIAAIALLWAAYAMRIKQVTARERSRLQERLSELPLAIKDRESRASARS